MRIRRRFSTFATCLIAACMLLLPGCAAGGKPGTGAHRSDPHRRGIPGHAHTAIGSSSAGEAEKLEAKFLEDIRPLTFAGARSGEGYFSSGDAELMIFQSEREPENPFYQMYLFDRVQGELARVSTGIGKTTCGWIHPGGDRVLFSSTHLDPKSKTLQQEELEFRASGKQRRYSWDYDPHYDIFERRFERRPGGSLAASGSPKRLTRAFGYDAEASWSPDGSRIVFASNRAAYAAQKNALQTGGLSEKDAKLLGVDPSYFIDIYSMAADGTGIKRLTNSPGYDGGPFFSADGRLITWRRFAANGATAEIYVMDADGGNQRVVTNLNAMSWAPYFHPSGDYLIFATNLHGFENFELYMTRTDGAGKPVRVTFRDGFDGLPVFTPDGRHLSWTSKRSFNETSQIFLAAWDDRAARAALGLETAATAAASSDTAPAGRSKVIANARKDVTALASAEMAGRLTGTEGERKATAYAAGELQRAGFLPAGDGGSYYQEFAFTSGVKLGKANQLLATDGKRELPAKVDDDWRPLAFSATGSMPARGVVFAGYGIIAPELKNGDGKSYPEYDSYVHLDVKDKWVIVLRDSPEEVDPELRAHLIRHAGPRFKAMIARDRGAAGILFVRGPASAGREELMKLSFDAALAGTSIAVASISEELARKLLGDRGDELAEMAAKLDRGEPVMGFEVPAVRLSAEIDIVQEKRRGRNVLAYLPAANAKQGARTLVVGAHIDHLGKGKTAGSLSTSEDSQQVHFGADDNASGVAAALQLAREIGARQRAGELRLEQNLLIALWSGEELGLIGSSHFVNNFSGLASQNSAAGKPGPKTELAARISGYLNMDMVGRMKDKLIVQGIASSPAWLSLLETANAKPALNLALQNDTYLPTDATSFYLKKVPILSLFTGVHRAYHTPADTPDKIEYAGLARVVELMTEIASRLLVRKTGLPYQSVAKPEHFGQRAVLRAYLGTIPDYADTSIKGVRLAGVAAGGPADKAGLKAEDVIVKLNGKKIENIYDYTFAIETLKAGSAATITVLRAGSEVELEIVPQSRR